MQSTQTLAGEPVVQVPVMVAAELQDSLLVVMRDLHRLEGLLNHATANLLERFRLITTKLRMLVSSSSTSTFFTGSSFAITSGLLSTRNI